MYGLTYKQKKVIKLAPDAIVRIHGNPYIQICPFCKATLNISDYITSISTSLANNSTVGTANFSIAMPRHGHNGNYMVRGGRLFGFNLMDPVEIYIKARYPMQNDDRQYYKVFWGMITSIDESYSDGNQIISISCESMLKWFQLMNTNEHPSVTLLNDMSAIIDVASSLWASKTYANMTPYEIIYSLVNITLLNVVVPDGLNVEQVVDESGKKISVPQVTSKDIEMLEAWKKIFNQIKSSLRMFGTSPESITLDYNAKRNESVANNSGQTSASQDPTSPFRIKYDSKALMDFKPFLKLDDAKKMEPFVSTYKNNLEIVSEVKTFTGFEFYQDTNGEIVFKPPFWNLDVRNNPLYVIDDSDILSWNFVENESEIVTRIEVSGSLTLIKNTDAHSLPHGVFTNYSLARQFGMRHGQIQGRYFTTAAMCFYHAISEMDFINSNRFRGSLTIIGRPELKLGYPLYIKSRDCYVYVDNISHNFSMRGPFTTQVQFSAMRRKYLGEKIDDAAPIKVAGTEDSYTIKGGAKMLLYSQDASLAPKIKEKPNTPDQENVATKITDGTKPVITDKNSGVLTSNIYMSNKAGTYKEVDLNNPEARKVMRSFDVYKDSDNQIDYLNLFQTAIPVSDEQGYELIGIYENGRSYYLSKDNKIKRRGKSFDSILKQSLSSDVESRGRRVDPTEKSLNDDGGLVHVTETFEDQTNYVGINNTLAGENTKQEIAVNVVTDFSAITATALANLMPSLDTSNLKTCSCFEPKLKGVSLKETDTNKSSKLIASKKNG